MVDHDEWGDDDRDADVDVDNESGEAVEPKRELYYATLDQFVDQYLRHVYARQIDGQSRVWAAEWWRYPEACVRLSALWRAWEELRHDGAFGMSVWFRDHADHHMPVLMDPQGPFVAASVHADENKCGKGEPLPHLPAPDGLLDGL